jgi:hypothetical protein
MKVSFSLAVLLSSYLNLLKFLFCRKLHFYVQIVWCECKIEGDQLAYFNSGSPQERTEEVIQH